MLRLPLRCKKYGIIGSIIGIFSIVSPVGHNALAQTPKSLLTLMNPSETSEVVFTVRDVGPGTQDTKLYIVWKDATTSFDFQLTSPNNNTTASNDGDPCETTSTAIPGESGKQVKFCKRTVIDALPEKVLGDIGDPLVEITITHTDVASAECWNLTVNNTTANRERVALGIQDAPTGVSNFEGFDSGVRTISRFIRGSSTSSIKNITPFQIPKDPGFFTTIDITWADATDDLSVEMMLPNGNSSASTTGIADPSAPAGSWSSDPCSIPQLVTDSPGPSRYVTICRDHPSVGVTPNIRISIGTGPTTPVDLNECWKLIVSSPLDKVEEVNLTIDPGVSAPHGNFVLFRKPIDVMVVLDRTASMNGFAGSSSATKWEAAVAAAELFTNLYYEFSVQGDYLGLNHFSCNCFDSANLTSVVHPLQSLVPVDVSSLLTGMDPQSFHCTPIGEGLISAMNQFIATPTVKQKVILLLTDGIQICLRDEDDFETELASPLVPPLVKDMSIFTVAVGDETDVDEPRINQLALDHYGDYRRTEDVVILPQFYAQILGSILGEDLNVEATATGHYPISSGEEKAAFILTWQDRSRLLDISQLQRPGGAFITPATTSFSVSGVTYTVIYSNPQLGDAYAYYIVKAPAGSSLPVGNWKFFNIIDNTNPATPVVAAIPHQTFVLLQRNLLANFSIDRNEHETGDVISLYAEVREDIVPITSKMAEVYVEVSKPDIGTGTFMAKYKLPKSQPALRTEVDKATPRLAHIDQLFRRLKWETWPRSKTKVRLYDDGTHGDATAGDGRWTGRYTDTKREGTYHFKFTAKGRTPSGNDFSRTKTISSYVRVNVDPKKTKITVEMLPPEKFEIPKDWWISKVTVTPLDKFGGSLGPYHTQAINFDFNDKSVRKFDKFVDNLDGTYSQIFTFNPEVISEIKVAVQGKPMRKTAEVGKPDQKVKFPPCFIGTLEQSLE